MKINFHSLINTVVISTCFFLSNIYPSKAQINQDNTLPSNTNIGLEGNIHLIEGGTRAGSNLFHSFQNFSVPTKRIVHFNNPLDIQNIITRVTGGSISNIDGLIRANGTANLFLINPNGITFGKNARLDIGGSFLATTADSMKFSDGSEFSTLISSQNTPLLTVNIPIGLTFIGGNGNINVKNIGHNLDRNANTRFDFVSPFDASRFSDGLQVKPNNTLALIGGNILLEGGLISTKNGRIELGSIKEGEVLFKQENNNLFLDYNKNPTLKDIQLLDNSLIYVNSNQGIGNTITVQGNQITISNGSMIFSQNQGYKQNASLTVNANRLIVIGESQLTLSAIYTSNFGNTPGEDIQINANEIDITGSQIATTTFTDEPSGNIEISSQYLRIIGTIPSAVNPDGFGGINTFSYNLGRSGDITGIIQNIIVERDGILTTNATSFGDGGNLNISAENIILKDGGASLGSTTFGTGRGGNVFVNANSIEITGITPFSRSSTINAITFGRGDAGNIELNTSKLSIRDGGSINTSTFSFGNAGNIIINASNSIEVLDKNSNLSNSSFITSSATILPENLRIRFRLPPYPNGNAGNININTENLNIAGQSQISVANDGSGDAGTISVSANTINLTNKGGITATSAVGEGGDIAIDSKILQLRNGTISTTAGQLGGNGDGGNITTNTDILVAQENSNITANAFQGRGGNIKIDTQGLFLAPNSQITASSEKGVNGTIQTNTSQLNSTLSGITQSPFNPLSLNNTCSPETPELTNELLITGRGGFPQKPQDLLSSTLGWTDKSVPTSPLQQPEQQQTIESKTPNIVIAQGWKNNHDGTVSFTVTPEEATSFTSSSKPSCLHSFDQSQQNQ